MPPGNKSRKGKRERGRDGHGVASNHSKALQLSGDKRTPTTIDNEATSKQATTKSSTLNNNVLHANEEEDMTAAICWICAEPIKYYSLPSCNHRTCHVCALRLRALYEKVECTFCKEPQSTVIFTTSPDADFSSYTFNALPHKSAKLAIFFETEGMMEETLKLLRFNCPNVECDYTASGWRDLKLHARAVHGKVFCDLCIRHKKVFPHEHALYLPNVLPLHLPSIPNRSGQLPLNQTVECGVHPLCAFCNECFFGDDEMFVHMREQHEECFLCKRNEIRYQYYQNYDSLEQHFSQAHFACADSACQARKFVVFDSELDLNAHRLEVHRADMSQRDRKEARRVQLEPHEAGSSIRRAAQETVVPESLREKMRRIAQIRGNVSGMPREGVEGMSEGTWATWRSMPNGRVASAIPPMPHSITIKSSAHELISTVWNVLDQNLESTAMIIKAVIDFLGEEEKKHVLSGAWNEYETESEQRYQSYDLDPTGVMSHHADTTSGTTHVTAFFSSPPHRTDQLDRQVVQPGSPSSPSSPAVPVNGLLTLAPLDSWGLEAFPSLARPRSKSVATPQSHQSHKSKSWATIAALPHSPSSPIPSKNVAPPRQLLSPIKDHASLSVAGPSFDTDVMATWCYPSPSQSPHAWPSLGGSDLSAWTPSWNTEGGGSVISDMTTGQGKKGKGKQKQRFASGSF